MSNNPRIPEPQFPYRHKLDVQLRFNDIDMLGHVNNSVYIEFFDLGKLTYFQKSLGPDCMKANPQVVVVNINCNFFAPSFLGEPLQVLTAMVNIGEKSLRLEQRIVNTATGEVKCMALTTMACVDLKTMTPVAVPADKIAAFEEFESHPIPRS